MKISAFIAKQEQAPTYFEIGLMIDSTRANAVKLVQKLEKKKFLSIQPNTVRGISILKEA